MPSRSGWLRATGSKTIAHADLWIHSGVSATVAGVQRRLAQQIFWKRAYVRAASALALWALLAIAGSARAQTDRPLVLVLSSAEHGEASTPFVTALRIQLTSAARVRPGAALAGAGLAENLERASALLAESGATLAVWLELARVPEGAETTAVLYVVGQEQDLALVRVARVVGRTGPELDRSLALTVAELLESVLALRRASSAREEPAIAHRFSAPSPTAPPEVEPTPPARWSAALEIGAGVALGTGTLAAAFVGRAGLSARLDEGRMTLEVGAVVQLPSRIGAERAGALAEVDELSIAAGAQLFYRPSSAFAAGGFAQLGARLVEAHGRASDGREGTARAALPALWIGADGRWSPVPGLELRLALGVEVTAIAQRFTVVAEPVLDLGVVRPVASLSIVVRAP